MSYLGYEIEELLDMGAIHTSREICQQPELWIGVYELLKKYEQEIASFVGEAYQECDRIILTGAGSSAFIGATVRSHFQVNSGKLAEAIATTDLVSNPRTYFTRKHATLLISFARSGNSPESLAAVKLADELCDQCTHLIITCNKDGELARYQTRSKKYVFCLPEEANDQSLAMTSSFTGMVVAGICVSKMSQINELAQPLTQAIEAGQKFINEQLLMVKKMAELPFNRIVFLGSGDNYGIAKEAALKLLELTDGVVMSAYDSFLGFRHGPKSMITDQTLMVYFVSPPDEHAYQYERDLINSIKLGTRPLAEVTVSEYTKIDITGTDQIIFTSSPLLSKSGFLSVLYILVAQTLGVYKSISLSIKPDIPSRNNDISRIVEGVTIYELFA
ncbi:MAG: SIS domain-containing protein [Saprospiraceae bacterium]|nr:SIS domain-containing protein [Saprospiraceae bacterium]